MNDSNPMMSQSFGLWPQGPPPPQSGGDPMIFQARRPMFPPIPGANPGRVHWKVKKAADKRKKAAAASAAAAAAGDGTGYKPPTLNELQYQNRQKAKRFYPNKKKFSRIAPYAPRNTTSFIIRAKKSGGIAPLVSPCPVTPAILPTPKFSPSREGLVDMAKEEWGVDGYGSMKGLIRLRSATGAGGAGEDSDEDSDGSSESDVEEHLEVERRLDHDLSRFEMVYPSFGEDQGAAAAYLLENRVDDQDTHIAQLEEENLTLKERLFLVEREMGDLRRRLQILEAEFRGRGRDGINNNNDDEINPNVDDNEGSYSGNHNNNNNNNNVNLNEEGDVCSENGDESNETQTPMREE